MAENSPSIVSNFDFVRAAEEAKTLPPVPDLVTQAGKAINLPAVFETDDEAKQRDNQYIENKPDPIKPGVEVYHDLFSKVFVVYRPWEKCGRCRAAIDDGSVNLPQDNGDYVCPHTQVQEYQQCVNRGLHGDVILTLRDNFMTPDGVRRVHVEWLQPNEQRQEEIRKKLKKKKANTVYPPDPEAIFSKKEPTQ